MSKIGAPYGNKNHYKHGGGKTRLYAIWKTMRQRCLNPKNVKFKNYGKRGITICSDWDDFSNFREWAINNGYRESLTLDRIDVNGNYEPVNCRWVSLSEQANNKTTTCWVMDNSERISAAEYCRRHGLNYKSFMKNKSKNVA